ncbi:MAG: c-type cytochrome [Hydrogenophilales bacterium]|nr:c-type cytochrome [Hydrogenophilales bacterium]
MKLHIAVALAGMAFTGIALAGPTEDLARTCNACHGVNGVSVGPSMPSIGGLPEAHLKNVMLQWKTDERYSATMGRHFKGYTEAELSALATYYSKLPYVPTVQKADDKIMAKGKEATDRCETCHGATGGEPDDAETPKLNGQWAQYLELELMKYRNDAVKMPHKKMRNNAKKLADEDVAAVAEFYAAQPK